MLSATAFSGVIEVPFEVLDAELGADGMRWLGFLGDPVGYVRALDEGGGMTARYDLRADWTRRDPASWPADHFRFRAPVGRTIHRVATLAELVQPPAPGADDLDL